MLRFAVLLALALTIVPTAPSQCEVAGTNGVPMISATSDLWDSRTDFVLSNALPGAPWAWFLDITPGPTVTPFGNFCFGPNALIVGDSFSGAHPPIDINGEARISGSILSPAIIGFPLFMQAVVVDFGAAFGVARSNSLLYLVEAPRLYVSSGSSSLDVLDAEALANGSGPVLLDSFPNAGSRDFTVSRDGDLVFTRGSSSEPVFCYDVSTVPATLLGSVSYAMTPPIRPGVAVSSDGADGYFLESSNLVRFDADPSSPSFLQVTGNAPLGTFGVQGIAISPSDDFLYVVGGDAPSPGNPSVMIVVDVATLQQVATVPLSNTSLLLGFAVREPIRVSPDGEWVATIQQGSEPFSGSALNVVGANAAIAPTFLQEVGFVTLPNTSQVDLAFSADGATVYTVDRDAGGAQFLSAIDWSAGTVSSVPLGVSAVSTSDFEGSVDVSTTGQHVYVALPGDDSVKVFDQGLSLIQSFPLASSGAPYKLRLEIR